MKLTSQSSLSDLKLLKHNAEILWKKLVHCWLGPLSLFLLSPFAGYFVYEVYDGFIISTIY
jgi:hypothetical protein